MITYLDGRQALAAPLAPQPTPFPPAVDMPGAQLLGVHGAVYVSMVGADGSTWEWASIRDVFRPLTQDILLTVGVGGNYATLGEALTAVSQKFPAFRVGDPVDVELRIKAGTVLREQLAFRSLDMGFVRITSEDPVVQVDASGFTTPAFLFGQQSDMPALNCKLQMINGMSSNIGINVIDGSSFTTADPKNRQDQIAYPAQVKAYGFINAGVNLSVNNAQAQLAFSDFDDALFIGIESLNGARVGLYNTNARGAPVSGLSVRLGATATMFGGGVLNTMGGTFRNDFRKVIGVDDTGSPYADIHSAGGTILTTTGSGPYRGGCNIPFNTLTPNGMFLKITGP